MKKSNYAFVSALYASKTKGLYSDIYFPIIKYSLAKIYAAKIGGNVYCTADEVSEFIDDKFCIRIPTIVIAKSVCKICNKPNFSIDVYENGSTFQIKEALYDEENIEDKERFFSDKLEEIERKYKDFLRQQECTDDGVSFLQFIADNTDEVLGYFENENKSNVNDKYATLILFLQYIHDADKELYSVVHQLFWSSVVVAFLKSEKPLVNDSCNGINAEYFLDTSIVLGLLGLSTVFKESYSREVCSIILNSGGLLKVNPMTVEEVKGILEKVELCGPYPLTDIADSYTRNNMTSNKLAKIRLTLEKMLQDKQIAVFPNMSPIAIRKTINDYKGKSVIRLLRDFRRNSPSPFSKDNFREIHDVYMDHYVKGRRKEKGVDEGVYFMTDNVELVKFCREQHNDVSYMVTTGKVVLDLWMHSKQTIDVSDCVLTETMARCLGLHKSNVRYKIMEVARFYNQTKDDFDPQVYKDFIGHLYRRAKNVIAATEQISQGETIPQSIAKLIKEAVDKDNKAYNNSLALATRKNQELQKESKQKEKQIEDIKSTVVDLKGMVEDSNKRIEDLKSEQIHLSGSLQQQKDKLQKTTEELAKAKQEKDRANEKIKLFHEREGLINKMEKLEFELQMERKKAFKNREPLYYKIGGYGSVLICILMIVAVFIGWLNGWMLSVALAIIPVSIFLFNRRFTLVDREEERAKKAYAKWEKRSSRYRQLVSDFKKLDERLKEINEELKD